MKIYIQHVMFHLMKSENDFALVIFDKFNTPTLSISKTASKTNKQNEWGFQMFSSRCHSEDTRSYLKWNAMGVQMMSIDLSFVLMSKRNKIFCVIRVI